MKNICLPIIVSLLTTIASCQDKSFDKFTKEFVTSYRSLNLPDLELSYVANLKNIKSKDSIEMQSAFFTSVKNKLKEFSYNKLSTQQKDDYDQVNYETNLNLLRIDLEKKWVEQKRDSISPKGLFSLPDGKEWYAYYLKKWVADDISPDQIFQFGLSEVESVKKNIEKIREQTGLSEADFYRHLQDTSFFYTNKSDIQRAFEKTKQTVFKNLHNIFSARQIPDVNIVQGENKMLAQTPGYYSNNTFYYNYFDKPYNKRQVDWLFIHEAVPGHHYQGSIARQAKQSDVQGLFYYLGFSEGWAAYAEELGKEVGLYKTVYDELGKYEWDLVRSVRVPLDVALNYYGWSDEQALAFWKKNIINQDDIALREIARMHRWPAQVITYKYGARQIMQWKEALQKNDPNFNIIAFHDKVLGRGSLPLFMVKRRVMGEVN